MGIPAADLNDETLERELLHLHETRSETFFNGTEAALEAHPNRMLQLEQAFRQRRPDAVRCDAFPDDAFPDDAFPDDALGIPGPTGRHARGAIWRGRWCGRRSAPTTRRSLPPD